MKKLFSLLTLALLTMSAWAATDVTIDFTAQGYANQAVVSELTVDPVTVTFAQGSHTNTAPTYYTSGTSIRIYVGNTMTVAVPNNSDPITKIEFTYNSGAWVSGSPDTGTYSSGVWSGSANSIVFTNNSNAQVRLQKMVVTLGGDVIEIIAAPTLPASREFQNSYNVEITNNAADATVKYSTDSVTWNDYTAPFTITETTTVYAKAVKGQKESEVVSATYTKLDVDGIAFLPGDFTNVSDTEFTLVKDPVTIYCEGGTITDDQFRIFKGKQLNFSATDVDIVKIEFTCTANGVSQYGPGCFSLVTSGEYTFEGNIGTWTGKTNNVEFLAATNQVRATKIVVTLDDGTTVVVNPPTIPASQNFDESITVEITNIPEGATAMYTTGERDWTEYTTPLTFTETTTLHAKAVKDGVESTVVSATYTKNDPQPEYTTLAQVNALPTNTDFEFKGDAVVTKQRGAYLWLRDESGYGLIYGNINNASDVTFAPGTVLSQGWTAKTKIYSGLMEYVNSANVAASGNTNAAMAAIQTITELDTTMVNAYVQVKNVKSFAVDGKNVTATMIDGTTMVMYNQFSESIPTEEGNYTVEGVVSTHNALQLMILGIEGYVPQTYNVNNIAEVYELSENSTFTMYNDCVVTYQNGNRLWIRDTENASGLIFGTVEGTFANGDVLSDEWTAKYTVYNNVPEFTEPEGIAKSGDTREAAPFERTTITNANVNEYVILKSISVLQDASNAKRYYNAADSLVMFNTFNLTLPEIEEGKKYDVTGLVTIYYGKPQVYITEMTEVAAAGLRGDVDNSGTVDITDATTLINYLLNGDATGMNMDNANCDLQGGVDISDATTLINFLLNGSWPN